MGRVLSVGPQASRRTGGGSGRRGDLTLGPTDRASAPRCTDVVVSGSVVDGEEVEALEDGVSKLALALFAAGTVEGTLQQIVSLAEGAVDGCDAAGVIAVDDDGTAVTLAASSELVESLDTAQVDLGEGPCLDAAVSGFTMYAEDLHEDPRWPSFSAAAEATGIRCVLALSLSAEQLSALNLFARLPAAFGATDRAKGQIFATLARLALDSAQERAAGEARSVNLQAALGSRELIGQAQGILMERERITAEQAFDVLRRASQHLNIKLATVAETLVDTGERPDTGTTGT